jgi:hypothetical protein
MRQTTTTAPITIRKSSTDAPPFGYQHDYEQAYADGHKDQPIAVCMGLLGSQNCVQGSESYKQYGNFSKRFLDSL